jgi:hypothetical protein
MNTERRSTLMLAQEPNGLPEGSSTSRKAPRKRVTEARALAQRAKLDKEQQEHTSQKAQRSAKGKNTQQDLQAKRRASTTIARAIDDYLQDHEGGNHSAKTIEWHQIALGLMQTYLEQERAITLVGEIDASDISSWFASMRKTPGKHGKPRTERTIQTYARSARAFFHWLVRRGTLEHNPLTTLSFLKWVGHSSKPSPLKILKSSCLHVPHRTRQVLLLNERQYATEPFSGCSMILASASPNLPIFA